MRSRGKQISPLVMMPDILNWSSPGLSAYRTSCSECPLRDEKTVSESLAVEPGISADYDNDGWSRTMSL
jgi:hypothetical protein